MSITPAAAAPTERFTFEGKPHGEGGFGRVIRGRDHSLDRDIAVKVLYPLLTQFEEAERERFKLEARTLARLSHHSYERIAGPAFERAFEYEYDGRLGRKGLRTAIEIAAASARGEVFDVLVGAAVRFVQNIPLDERDGWYLHGLRDILQSLLANPSCTKGAADIAGVLRAVNKAQRKTQS